MTRSHHTLATILVASVPLFLGLSSGCFHPPVTVGESFLAQPYLMSDGVIVSRSISFENPTGAPGEGGKAASRLGPTRKGKPMIDFEQGGTVTLCDIEGPGTIRHIWMTTRNDPVNLRSLVIRAWWDDQDHPSIECPIGDFMGTAHGKVVAYHSAVHSLGRNAGMNIWIPMPFTKRARITLTNDGPKTVPIYYQIDYTLGDRHPADVGRLHVLFQRENPTTEKEDFVLLPTRTGAGRFMGCVIGVRNLHQRWWGEGEIKFFMDGDTEFPTICGTGSEDYVGLSYGMQDTPFLYNGCNLNQKQNGQDFVSMYRWHLPDPIYWQRECRVTIQQIAWQEGLVETSDDWSCATFWYEPVPSAPLPELPDADARTRDIQVE